MITYIQRQEAIQVHRAYLDQYLAGEQDDPPDYFEDANEVALQDVIAHELQGDPESLNIETVVDGVGEVEDERNIAPEPVYYPNAVHHMAKTPTVKKLPIQDMIDHYGASNIILNITDFLTRRCQVALHDVLISRQNQIALWHKLYLYHHSPSFAPFDPVRRDVVRASAPRPREPGIWDVALYLEKPNRARSASDRHNKHGLDRYRAGCVRALFTLPVHLQLFYPGQLVYLELFTTFDAHPSPYTKLHSTKPDFNSRGVRRTLVIPVSDIVFACHLVPKFYMLDPELELHTHTDLLADSRRARRSSSSDDFTIGPPHHFANPGTQIISLTKGLEPDPADPTNHTSRWSTAPNAISHSSAVLTYPTRTLTSPATLSTPTCALFASTHTHLRIFTQTAYAGGGPMNPIHAPVGSLPPLASTPAVSSAPPPYPTGPDSRGPLPDVVGSSARELAALLTNPNDGSHPLFHHPNR
ncbi:unnamed protein product [Rhizoctonia solani]|uniref:Uncharacterized protein n=1 Tax=Rhizoctonia solani TaxID=456999 RepID=A0A8H3GVE5_9AGAM|nr:unnamed protein product [Rhizoctonia solani]